MNIKHITTLLLLTFFSIAAFAQQKIELSDISKHVGDSVAVVGKISGMRYFPDGKNAPTLVNIGGAFPNQLLTVVIYGDDRKNFKPTPEEVLNGKLVEIKGKVELYRDRPQIIVKDEGGIQVVTEEKKQ